MRSVLHRQPTRALSVWWWFEQSENPRSLLMSAWFDGSAVAYWAVASKRTRNCNRSDSVVATVAAVASCVPARIVHVRIVPPPPLGGAAQPATTITAASTATPTLNLVRPMGSTVRETRALLQRFAPV